MYPDINYFGKYRELFPRHQKGQSSRLICGHLNRLKFNHNIGVYLQNRNNKVSRSKALARASRCYCYQGQQDNANQAKKKIEGMYELIGERKRLSNQLQNVNINVHEMQLIHKDIEKREQFIIYSKSLKRLHGIEPHHKSVNPN